MFWVLVADTALSVLTLAVNQLTGSVSTGGFELWWQFSLGLGALVDLAAMGLLTYAALQVAAASTETNRGLALGSAALFVLRAVLNLCSIVSWLVKLELSFLQAAPAIVLSYALYYVSWGLFFGALGRSSKGWGLRFPVGHLVAAALASVASLAGSLYWRSMLELPYEERPGLWFGHLRSALNITSVLALAAVFFVCRARLLRAPAAASATVLQPRRSSDPVWSSASDGLSLYRGGLLARIALALLGIPWMMVVAKSGDADATKLLLVLLTLFTLVCGGASIIGLFGYATVPESSGARAPARTALGIGIAGGVFDVWALILVIRLAGGSVSAAFSYMAQAPWVEAAAQATGLVALMYLLSSFHHAAVALGASELANSASSVGWLLGIAGFAALIVKLIATTARGASELVILALPAVLILLFGIARFVSLVGALARVMREGPVEPGEPSPPLGS